MEDVAVVTEVAMTDAADPIQEADPPHTETATMAAEENIRHQTAGVMPPLLADRPHVGVSTRVIAPPHLSTATAETLAPPVATVVPTTAVTPTTEDMLSADQS